MCTVAVSSASSSTLVARSQIQGQSMEIQVHTSRDAMANCGQTAEAGNLQSEKSKKATFPQQQASSVIHN